MALCTEGVCRLTSAGVIGNCEGNVYVDSETRLLGFVVLLCTGMVMLGMGGVFAGVNAVMQSVDSNSSSLVDGVQETLGSGAAAKVEDGLAKATSLDGSAAGNPLMEVMLNQSKAMTLQSAQAFSLITGGALVVSAVLHAFGDVLFMLVLHYQTTVIATATILLIIYVVVPYVRGKGKAQLNKMLNEDK